MLIFIFVMIAFFFSSKLNIRIPKVYLRIKGLPFFIGFFCTCFISIIIVLKSGSITLNLTELFIRRLLEREQEGSIIAYLVAPLIPSIFISHMLFAAAIKK